MSPRPAGATPVAGEGRLRAAALVHLFLGLGFGLSTPFVLASLERNGELPMMFGFRALSGPFEGLGRGIFVSLGWLLVAVCGADVVAALLLWQRRRLGAWLALVATPLAFVLGVGFALPLMLIGVPARVLLVIAGRRALR